MNAPTRGRPSAPLVVCDAVARTYGQGVTATVALSPTSCTVETGQRIALTGPSGSGKSTLLYLMAGIEQPTTGTVSWPAIGSRESLRPAAVALVFQGPSLLAPLTVIENVAFPLILGGTTERRARGAAGDALAELGLGDLAEKLPDEISGGQAQRVAVARALAGTPVLILADEPTGQLDHVNGTQVMDVLARAAQAAGAALVVSTHDDTVVGFLEEQWAIHNGELLPASVA